MSTRAWLVALGTTLLVAAGIMEWLEPEAAAPSVRAPTQARGEIVAVSSAAPASTGDAVSLTSGGSETVARPQTDQIQLCGGDWVEIDANGWLDEEALAGLERVQSGRKRILATLRASSDAFRQAAAEWLEPSGGVFEPQPGPADTPCDDDCRTSIIKSRLERHEQLARRAAASTDPRIYALAFRSCRLGALRGGGSCMLLSAEQWARLDPGNALPWVYALGEADMRGDAAARDEALHRIATSARLEEHFLAVAGLIVETRGGDGSLLATMEVVSEAAAREAAWLPPYPELLQACRAARTDANRNQTCLAIAEQMVGRADKPMARSIGVAVGHGSGWPVERVDRLRGELKALALASIGIGRGAAARDPRGASCPQMRQELDRIQEIAEAGEIAVAQRALAKSNLSLEALTLQARETRLLDEAQRGAPSTPAAPTTHGASAPPRRPY